MKIKNYFRDERKGIIITIDKNGRLRKNIFYRFVNGNYRKIRKPNLNKYTEPKIIFHNPICELCKTAKKFDMIEKNWLCPKHK